MTLSKNTTKYYAPYMAICQSSGYGKTKLMLEFSKDVYLFFTCLRGFKSSGDPPRSMITTVFLSLKSEADFAAYYCAFFRELRAFFKPDADDETPWITLSAMLCKPDDESNQFWGRVKEETASKREEFAKLMALDKSEERPSLDLCLQEMVLEASLFREIVKKLGKDRPFIFALDEASAMMYTDYGFDNSKFIAWRRVIAALKKIFFSC